MKKITKTTLITIAIVLAIVVLAGIYKFNYKAINQSTMSMAIK